MEGVFDYIPEVLNRAVEDTQPIDVKGKVIQVVGTIIKAAAPSSCGQHGSSFCA